ncbi:MAG: DNA internalization-related competence protein ComEC/Rec2 [Symbiobacteriaceae bacterium]|nr:DNA internalization-related competence protein ComEC/Rec2 [Symbiobacteriaceae bacterium]
MTVGTWILRKKIQDEGLVWSVLLLSLALGYFYASAHWLALPEILPVDLDRQEARIQGMVGGFPRKQGHDWILDLNDLFIHKSGKWIPLEGHIRLRLYPARDPESVEEDSESSAGMSWQPGDIIEAIVKINRYRQGRNFGDPDWSLLFRRRGIIGNASGNQDQVELLYRLPQDSWNLQLSLYKTRQMVISAFLDSGQEFMQREWVELLSGLTIGMNDELPEEWDDAFRQAGVVHLLVVSGGHFAVLFLILRFLLRYFRISLWGERAFLIVVTIAYMLLTGSEPSILRAGITALILIAAEIMHRRPEWPSLLIFSAILILLHNPFAIFEAGFQLSYLSVAGIMLFNPIFTRWLQQLKLPRFLVTSLGVTFAAQLGVLPLGVQLFNQISLVAPLSNLLCAALIIPIQFIAILLILLAPFGAFATTSMALCARGLLHLLVSIAQVTASLPGAVWNIPSPGWPLVFVFYGALLLLVLSPETIFARRKKMGLVSGIVMLSVVMIIHPWPYQFEVIMLDVGQGDSIFIRFPNGKTMLIDGGGSAQFVSEVGRYTIVPFLRRQGVQYLDFALFTHPHEDHYQGVMQTYDRFPTKMVGLPRLERCQTLPAELSMWLSSLPQMKYLLLNQGEILDLDSSVLLEVISAPELVPTPSFGEVNNSSLVLRLEYGKTVIWLNGDAEADIERQILGRGYHEQDAQVILKAAHHGSRNASSAEWLAGIKPAATLISVGVGNSYGHPSGETLNRLDEVSSLVLRTDIVGSVRLCSDGIQWSYETVIK